MTGSQTRAWLLVLLLCGIILPLIQVGVASAQKGGGGNKGGGGAGGGGNRGGGSPGPSRPIVTGRPSGPSISRPTAGPTMSSRPSMTSRPTLTGSFTRTASFTRTGSFTRSSFTFSPTFTFTSYTYGPTYTTWYPGYYPGYWYPGMTFGYYPTGYSSSTGSFTLGQTLYGPNNTPCLYYDYFEFNAVAGMTIQARLWTTGPPVNYIVLPASMISVMQGGNGCTVIGYLTQTNTIGSTPYVYSWTAPESGQYVVLFYATTPYTAPIYFMPQ